LSCQTDERSEFIYKTSGCPWPKATMKPPVWNPGPKIEIPHPKNHVLKVFRFRSWKPRVWKSRPQSWDPKSWKPCLENSGNRRFPERTAVVVPVLVRLPRKEWRVGQTDGLQVHRKSYILNQTWWTKIGQCLEDSSSHCPFPMELIYLLIYNSLGFVRWRSSFPSIRLVIRPVIQVPHP